MTISELKKQITDAFINNDTIKKYYNLEAGKSFEEQFSTVSIENILFGIIAIGARVVVQLFDLHKREVSNIIKNQKVGSLRWYAYMARQFQFGRNLNPDTDEYDNSGLTDEQIAANKIVAYSAVGKRDGVLLIKVAKLVGDDLAPLAPDELAAFAEYMTRVQCAGDELEYINQKADKLKLNLSIYYNPLVLNQSGQRLDGQSSTPVADGIRRYLRELPFNGELVHAYLEDYLQKIDGVVFPSIDAMAYQYGNTGWIPINVKYQPLSGYFTIDDNDLIIKYIPQTYI